MKRTKRSRSYYENELLHYGVKGMKWGVRKDKKSARSKVLNSNLYYKSTFLKQRASIAKVGIAHILLTTLSGYGAYFLLKKTGYTKTADLLLKIGKKYTSASIKTTSNIMRGHKKVVDFLMT